MPIQKVHEMRKEQVMQIWTLIKTIRWKQFTDFFTVYHINHFSVKNRREIQITR